MLVLSRKAGEAIMIGPDILVMVTAIEGNRCRIGVTAPQHMRVDRQEVTDRRQAEARSSKSASGDTAGAT